MTEELRSFGGEHTAKYRLGKITNKYLIIKLYTLAFDTQKKEKVMKRMFKVDKSSRNLLIDQYNLSLQTELIWPLQCFEINSYYYEGKLKTFRPLEFTI